MKNRKQKKKEKSKRQAAYHARLLKRYETVLAPIGADVWIRKLRNADKELLARNCWALLTWEFDRSVANDPNVSEFASALTKKLNESSEGEYSLNERLRTSYSFLGDLALLLTRPEKTRRESMETKLMAVNVANHCNSILSEMNQRLEILLALVSTIDSGPIWCNVKVPPGGGGITLLLGRTAPEEIRVEINGAIRPVLRCGISNVAPDIAGPTWITWPASMLGIEQNGVGFPVYIQRHAVDRLHERIRLPNNTVEIVNISLTYSLMKPNIIQQRNGDYFVEFRLGRDRLGYFIARRVNDVIVIRTFLFITMAGTPEGTRLRNNNGMVRYDIEHNKLDQLDTYLKSDIWDDGDLRDMLVAADCGHLESLDTDAYGESIIENPKTPLASQLRYYLGLDSAISA